MFGKLIEEKIREAMDAGEFDNLPGKGQPINLDDYFATPADLRLGYSVLKSAKCLPVELELMKEIEELKTKLAACTEDDERKRLAKKIEAKTLKLKLLLDARPGSSRK